MPRMDTVQTQSERSPQLRGVVGAWSSDRVEVLVPHTDYRLHLRPSDDAGPSRPPGTRIRGMVEGEAIRIHPMTDGGGRFIEPVIGEPRIVTGILRDMDPQSGRVIIEAVVPFRLTTLGDQDFSHLSIGGMVTCHVRSGLRLVLEHG